MAATRLEVRRPSGQAAALAFAEQPNARALAMLSSRRVSFGTREEQLVADPATDPDKRYDEEGEHRIETRVDRMTPRFARHGASPEKADRKGNGQGHKQSSSWLCGVPGELP